jgi:putative addiction module component (TIGR02574 family)
LFLQGQISRLAAMNPSLINQARELPLEQRIELIDVLWESIAEEGYEPPLTPEQAAELDRRLAAHRRDPNAVISWESIKEQLDKKYR